VNTETTKKAYRKAKEEVQGWISEAKDLANVNDTRRRGRIYSKEGGATLFENVNAYQNNYTAS
jgi:hypothetical protein